MTTDQLDRPLDDSTVDRLGVQFNECFRSFKAADGLFAPEAFFDLLPPFWRFQLRGGQAFIDQLRSIATGPTRVRILRIVPTAGGFVLEHEETIEAPEGEVVARRLWLCEVRDDRITAVTGYCNGGWDAELRARHAAEAPMIRP